jgi:superfamily II DNA or RNA helicase
MEPLVLEVGNCVTSIVQGEMNKDTYQEFRRALGYRPEGWQHAIRQYTEKVLAKCRAMGYDEDRTQRAVEVAKGWDGYVSDVRYNRGHCGIYQKRPYTHFSTGLLSVARSFFQKYNIPYRLVDGRPPSPPHEYDFDMSEEFEPRDYIIETRDKACKQKRGIIRCATGGGKTALAASIIAELGSLPFIFYVTSIELLHQAVSELKRFIRYQGIPIEVGAVGGGYKDIKPLTVMTVQTAVRTLGEDFRGDFKYDEEDEDDNTDISDIKKDIYDLIHSSKGMICDEVQHRAARTCQLIDDHSDNAYYRYGLSATPWRDKGDDILIDACFGKCISQISASFLIRKGYLVKPEINFVHIDNMKHCPYKSYPQIYKHGLKENRQRNEWIAKIALRMKDEGRLPLILCTHIDHGKMLSSLIPGSVFLHGSVSKKKRLEHLELMRQKSCGVTIATSIFDEGIDVRPLDTLILSGSGKSSTRALQRIGRILRPWPSRENNQKKDAIAVDFVDHIKYLEAHSRKRRKIYQTEEEFVIKDIRL